MSSVKDAVAGVHQLLRDRGQMLAVAESLTGGRIQSLMTSVSGASDVFAGGVTTYTVDAKVALLKVNRETASGCNGVSEPVVREMVAGVCELFAVDCGIATTGYAEPSDHVPEPYAWVGVSVEGKITAERVTASGSREDVQQAIAERALEMIRRAL